MKRPFPHHPQRPQGQATRGKTARNRLRRVDNFLLRYAPGLLQPDPATERQRWVVDLGFGATAVTTLEMARTLRQVNPTLPILGVEIDRARVAAAQPFADAHTTFRLGGFNLPLAPDQEALVIRAFNVLRQYDESQVAHAWWQMGQRVSPGGLLIEGTSDPFGRHWVANVMRHTGNRDQPWRPELLVFSTNFRTGFDPVDFQPVLPKNLIHHMVEGEWINDLFAAWKRAALETAGLRVWGVRQWFAASARRMAAAGMPVNTQSKWLRQGYLLVRVDDNIAPAPSGNGNEQSTRARV